MVCPSCGLQPLHGQKFCRACGANLQVTTQPLGEPSRLTDSQHSTTIESNRKAHRSNNYVLSGFAAMFIGAVIGVVGKKLLYQDIITVLGVIISLLGMFLIVYPYLLPSRPRRHVPEPRSPPADPAAPLRSLEPGNTEYISSITERTTDLLETPAAPKLKPAGDKTREA
jgi:hypothetical protein